VQKESKIAANIGLVIIDCNLIAPELAKFARKENFPLVEQGGRHVVVD